MCKRMWWKVYIAKGIKHMGFSGAGNGQAQTIN